MTDCQFTLNPKMMKFSLGGNILLQLADIVVPLLQTYLADYVENIVYNAIMNDLPNAFNAYVVN